MWRLITQWKKDSIRQTALEEYAMSSSCTSCHYFSYCYQENLFKPSPPLENQMMISRNIQSNDFPKNTKQWFFIHYHQKEIQWQIWENGETQSETRILLQEFPNQDTFLSAAADELHKQWNQSTRKKKTPHFLVYSPEDWYVFQQTFQETILKTMWATHPCWSAIQRILTTHFSWPITRRADNSSSSSLLRTDFRSPSSLKLLPSRAVRRSLFSCAQTNLELVRIKSHKQTCGFF